jgi:hypothetical protein
MSRRAWAFVLGGLLTGALAAGALDWIQRRQLAELQAQLGVVDQRLRELAAVKVRLDDYETARGRLETQLRAIDEERARRRCPGLLLSDLDLDRKAAPVEAASLEGSELALVGRAESAADFQALLEAVRGAKWTREVRSASAPAGEGSDLRFGFLVTVEVPACPVGELPVMPAATAAQRPPAEAR